MRDKLALFAGMSAILLLGFSNPATSETFKFEPSETTPVAKTAEESRSVHAVLKPLNEAVLSSQIQGYIQKIHVKEGSAFKAGDVLLDFDCTINKANLTKAKALLASSEKTFNSHRRLSKLNATSKLELAKAEADYNEAKAEKIIQAHSVNFCQIVAPFPGETINIKVNQFETVQANTPIIEIVDNSSLQIELILPSKWLSWLKMGHEFTLVIDETQRRYKAKISEVIPKVDSVSRSFRAIGVLQEPAKELMAGMSGRAEF